jgi:hypothetical protein
MLHGFDISAYQGSSAPAADFVFVKATEGSSYTNAKYTAQIASARAHAAVVGMYHFARPESSSAASQADRFLAVAKPGPDDLLCLDLEASDLTQPKTNAWAIAFAARLKEKARGNMRVIYMGSGYASNGTGRGLADHYDLWWYPQYPSSKSTSTWPGSFSPWLPGGLTCGWKAPHIWQFSSVFRGAYDANVSTLTLDQLAAGGQATPLEEDMPYGGQLPAGAGARANVSFPRGSMKAIGLVYDSPEIAEVRVAFHHKAGSGEVFTLKVGGPRTATDTWPAKTVQSFKTPADGDWVSLTRVDEGKDPVGWDMS